MKTNLIVGLMALNLLVPRVALCQATFRFQNLYVTIDAPVFDAQGVRLAGSDYLAELYGGAVIDSLSPAIGQAGTRVMAPFFTGIGAGYFQGPSVLIPTVPSGGSAWLQLRAWDTRIGPTYEEVAAIGLGGYGESPLFYAAGGNPFLVPPDPPRLLIGLQSFGLREVIPEPSTWALMAGGGLALCWAVRRHTAHARHARHNQ